MGYSSCKQTFLANTSMSSLELESFLRTDQERVHPAAGHRGALAGREGAAVVVLLWLSICEASTTQPALSSCKELHIPPQTLW